MSTTRAFDSPHWHDPRQTIRALTGLALVLSLAGCYVPSNGKSQAKTPATTPVLPKPGPHQVLVDSRWAYSATENRPAPEWLLERARQAAPQGDAGLDRLVQRWPDVALELLRQGVGGESDLPLRLVIAGAYDRVTAAAQPDAGWSAVVATTGAQRETYNRFRRTREQILALFKSGRFAEAAKIDPVAALPAAAPPALHTEALRLAGLAVLLNNQPDRAAALFARALETAAPGPCHIQFEIGLLTSEAQRRSGRAEASVAAWKSAVAVGANIRDPELWERALLAKPEQIAWPNAPTTAGAGEPDFTPGTAPDTAQVLIGVGKMYLARSAFQPALLALSRAETETVIVGERALARLYRAQSMIALQQAASALPMLETLLHAGDPRLVRRAQAVQGDVLCRVLDDRQHGIPLLREALAQADAGEWPGQSRLEANLGLYLILEGRDEEGLRHLHAAQARFATQAQWEDLADALKNEATALQAAGQHDAEAAVQQRADALCRKNGFPVGPLAAQTNSR